MERRFIQWLGLTGIVALLSYTAAVVFAPLAWPGYNWMAQAVSDLSAEAAPSRSLWNQLAAPYNICGVMCATCVAAFISEKKDSSRLFRAGIYLFMAMNWISTVGYAMFPLADGGKEIVSFQETMHIVVTAAVALLSIAALVCLIVAGCRERAVRGIGFWAAVALAMMLVGSIGTGVVPPEYFGIVERFSVFAAVGFNAVLGMHLFNGFKGAERVENHPMHTYKNHESMSDGIL